MTLKMQLGVLNKFGVESVEPQGEPSLTPSSRSDGDGAESELEPNTVMDVMQKGYLLNGRLVRPRWWWLAKKPIKHWLTQSKKAP